MSVLTRWKDAPFTQANRREPSVSTKHVCQMTLGWVNWMLPLKLYYPISLAYDRVCIYINFLLNLVTSLSVNMIIATFQKGRAFYTISNIKRWANMKLIFHTFAGLWNSELTKIISVFIVNSMQRILSSFSIHRYTQNSLTLYPIQITIVVNCT